MAITLFYWSSWGESPAVFPVIFILRLLWNIPTSAQQKVRLLKHGEMSNTSMGELQNFPASTGGFLHSQNWNFPEEGFILSSSCNSAGSTLRLVKVLTTELLHSIISLGNSIIINWICTANCLICFLFSISSVCPERKVWASVRKVGAARGGTGKAGLTGKPKQPKSRNGQNDCSKNTV